MRRTLVILVGLIAVVGGLLGSACGPRHVPMCRAPRTLEYVLEATDRVNPDDQGQSLATVVRVYQLRGLTRLENAEFEEIWLHAEDTLGDELVKVEEHTLFPTDRVVQRVEIGEGVSYLVAVALFRKPAGFSWRAIHELPLEKCPSGKVERPSTARFVLEDYVIEPEVPRKRGTR
jgi:type VI secretion system protein VasD